MDSIINDIHDLLDLPRPENPPARDALLTRLDPMVERIQAAFGLEFVDEFTELYADLYASNDQREFHLGFVTGARLMMEVLR